MRLQDVRKRRPMSQVDVAERLGIHPSRVSQYERGYLRLHGALLVRMAEVLKTTPHEILAVREIRSNGDEQAIDRRFLRRLKKMDKLSTHDKEAPPGHDRRLPLQGLLKARPRPNPSGPRPRWRRPPAPKTRGRSQTALTIETP
jgi:transcriptional regulator with XRE-family HTH domain